MKDLNLRSVLTLTAIVIGALLVLGVVSTILTNIVPLAIALIVGLILGRLSASVNLLDALRRRAAQPAARPAAAARPAPPPAQAEAAPPARLAEAEAPAAPEQVDLQIKTEAQVLEEARRLEEEATQRASAQDVQAALEARRKRLLGGEGGEP